MSLPLSGRHCIVTAGPTLEAIDPVRFLSNRSSGKQGYAIAGALANLGARVTLVSGPTALPVPDGVDRVDVESARDMLSAVENALPASIFIAVAAVADWRPAETATRKLKIDKNSFASLKLVENPDILKTISQMPEGRPDLVIGFAAETHDIEAHARAKLARKGCDWIVANDVSGDAMGGDENEVIVISRSGIKHWDQMNKSRIAELLADEITSAIAT